MEPQTLPSPSRQGKGEAEQGLTQDGCQHTCHCKERYEILPNAAIKAQQCHLARLLLVSVCTAQELPPAWGHLDWERQEHPSVRCAVTSHFHAPPHIACMGDPVSPPRCPCSAQGMDVLLPAL